MVIAKIVKIQPSVLLALYCCHVQATVVNTLQVSFFKECTAAAAFPTWRLRRLQYDTFYLVAEAKVNSLALGNNSRRGSMSRTKLLSEVGNEKVVDI